MASMGDCERLPYQRAQPTGASKSACACTKMLDITPCGDGVYLVPVTWLKPHEEYIPDRFKEVLDETVDAGGYRWPIIVDWQTGVILDGHHRHQCALRLGLSKVPAVVVDYLTDGRISVRRWTPDAEEWQAGAALKRRENNSNTGGMVSPRPARESLSTMADESSSLVGDSNMSNSELQETERCNRNWTADSSGSSDFSGMDDRSTSKTAGFVSPEAEEMATPTLRAYGLDLVFTPPAMPLPPSDDRVITKESVIRMGLSSKLFPPKTTRHFISPELYCNSVFFALNVLKANSD